MTTALLERPTESAVPMLPEIPALAHFEVGILKEDGNFASSVEIFRDGQPLTYIDLDLGFEMSHFDRPVPPSEVKSNSVWVVLVDGETYYKGNSEKAFINKFAELNIDIYSLEGYELN